MQRLVNKVTGYCVKEELIKPEDVPWFKYGLEKRLSTTVVGIPFLVVAFAISNYLCAISFFVTYFLVKKYMGGYHAMTIWGCLAFSLLLELVFLGVLPHFMTAPVLLGMLGISILAIIKLAPYNHPNLHLTHEEMAICRKKVHSRTCIASLVNVIACFASNEEIAKGCTVGIAMAATLLCLGYINDWRNSHYEKNYDQGNCKKGDCNSDV